MVEFIARDFGHSNCPVGNLVQISFIQFVEEPELDEGLILNLVGDPTACTYSIVDQDQNCAAECIEECTLSRDCLTIRLDDVGVSGLHASGYKVNFKANTTELSGLREGIKAVLRCSGSTRFVTVFDDMRGVTVWKKE